MRVDKQLGFLAYCPDRILHMDNLIFRFVTRLIWTIILLITNWSVAHAKVPYARVGRSLAGGDRRQQHGLQPYITFRHKFWCKPFVGSAIRTFGKTSQNQRLESLTSLTQVLETIHKKDSFKAVPLKLHHSGMDFIEDKLNEARGHKA